MTIDFRKQSHTENDFEFDGPPPQPDLLDYRHMAISMEKWAVTDSGCLSVVVYLGFAFACVLFFMAYSYLT
jgi:hypothetical protein